MNPAMIQAIVSLLMVAKSLLMIVQTAPVTPEFRAFAEQSASNAISYATDALAQSTSGVATSTVASYNPLGEVIAPVYAPSPIGSEIVVIPLKFTVKPTVTLLGTTTAENTNSFPDINYNVHFETSVPATAEFTIYASNEQDITVPATSFDISVKNIWAMQVPFRVTVTSVDGKDLSSATGVLKG